MAMVFYNEENQVTLTHYMPEQLPEEMKAQGVEVGEIPEPEERERKMPVLYINPDTKELWYEYVDRPLTEEERMQEMEQILADMLLDQMEVD